MTLVVLICAHFVADPQCTIRRFPIDRHAARCTEVAERLAAVLARPGESVQWWGCA